MGACFSSIYDVAIGDVAPAEAGSASGSLSAVQQLAAAIGSAVVTTVYFSQQAQHGAAHAMTVSVAVVAAIAVLDLGLVWLAAEVSPGAVSAPSAGAEGPGKLQRDRGAAAGQVAYRGPASVSMRDGADDRQPQSGATVAAGAPGVRPREALEGMRQELRGEAGASVADLDEQAGAIHPGREHDWRPGRGEPQRVVDQVVNGLADAVRVDLGDEPGGRVDLAAAHRPPGRARPRAPRCG